MLQGECVKCTHTWYTYPLHGITGPIFDTVLMKSCHAMENSGDPTDTVAKGE